MIKGSLDEFSEDVIRGWAADPDTDPIPVAVTLKIDGVTIDDIDAACPRPDVPAAIANIESPYHGFYYPTPKLNPGTYTLRAFVKETELDGSPKQLTIEESQDPIGYLDEVTDSLARGWAYDANAGETPIDVHIYDGNSLIAMTTANKRRPDLTPVVGDPYHGFQVVLPTLSLGTHTIHAYAINTPTGVNPELSNSPHTIYITGWREITGGSLKHVGESLFYMKEFSVDGKLYGATESSGKIVRFNGTCWDVVFETSSMRHGNWCNSYHLGDHGGVWLFTGFRNFHDTPTSIRVYCTDSKNWWFVHEEPDGQQCRFVDDFHGSFLTIISSYAQSWSKIYLRTSPHQSGIGSLIAMYQEFFYGDPVLHNNKLYIGGYGIYEIDSSFKMNKLYTVNPPNTVTSLHVHNGELHATVIQGWRATSGKGLLLVQRGNTFHPAKFFDEPEAWCQETYKDHLYVGTRQEGGGGRAYKLKSDYSSEVIGTTQADGFFSLREYQGKLFAGTYSQQQVRSYMYL